MAQSHIDQCNADLATGEPNDDAATLADYGFTSGMLEALLALPAHWRFLPSDSYCPQSDVPNGCGAEGLHFYAPGKLAIVIDNGLCAACWLLEEQPS